jgi:hypothetical protein
MSALVLCMACLPAEAASPRANGTATFNITIPELATLKELLSNSNSGVFPALITTPNAGGTAMVGSTNDDWEIKTNTNGGQVNVYCSVLNGPAALKPNVRLSVTNLASGTVPIVPSGAYAGAGKQLSAMPVASPGDSLCTMATNGKGHFRMTLTVNSPFVDGTGTITGTINIVGLGL